MKVGRVISDNKIKVPENFELSDSFKEIDDSVPTLLVGWSKVKENYPKTSIRNKKIKNNVYWTFSSLEKRGIFEKDLKTFIIKSYGDLIKDIELINIDPIYNKIKDIDTLIIELDKLAEGVGYLYLDYFYIFKDKKIYFLDIGLLKFVKFDYEMVINHLKKILSKTIEDDSKYEKFLKYLDRKYIPYLYAKQNTLTSLIC
jgi:hypothetical protein